MMLKNASAITVAGLGSLLCLSLAHGGCEAGNQGTDDVTSAGGNGFTTSGEGGGGGDDPGCASIEQQAVLRPLSLYIMLDRSSSMAGTKWDAAKVGLQAFLEDENSSGINLGFRSFPEGAPGCDQALYMDPTVGFATLPGISDEVVAELATLAPDGFSSPMYQALGGALLECIAIADDNPDEEAAVLLVTDGAPQGPAGTCGGVDPEDPQAIADLAAAALPYGVTTFVIGLPGVDQSFANLVAEAGGSQEAILVGTTNVESEFKQALAKVRGDLLPCEYLIPEEVNSGEVQLTEVNVKVGEDGGDPEIIPQNPDCDGKGWHYDDPANPTTIVLCPDSCDAISGDTGASIDIALGCETIVQ